jgi:hypothetical protein
LSAWAAGSALSAWTAGETTGPSRTTGEPTGSRPALEPVLAPLVVAHFTLATAVMAVVPAAVASGHPKDETAEEDGTDDEDAARDDADPCGNSVESAGPAFDYGWFGRRSDGSLRGSGFDGPGCGFGLRCFAHASMMRGPLKRW